MKIYQTIPEAHAGLLRVCRLVGYRQDIKRGSFANTDIYRVQMPVAGCTIVNHTFDRVPVPPTADWPTDMTMEAGEQYFVNYILAGDVQKNEVYTYGSRICQQLEDVMDMLKKNPNTNQAAIAIGREVDTRVDDPACLRELHFKYHGGRLHMYCIWRSHDLISGFPLNMYGMSKLLEMVAEYAELKTGNLFYYSSGSHIYSYSL